MAAVVSAPPASTPAALPIITCPYTAGGCPLFNTIDIPPASPRCAGSCAPSPAPTSAPPPPSASASASASTSTSGSSSAANTPGGLPRPSYSRGASSLSSLTYDDTALLFSELQSDVPLPLPSALLKQEAWSTYLDFAVSPGQVQSPPYLNNNSLPSLPGPSPAASTSASSGSPGSAAVPLNQPSTGAAKHSLWDIEELVGDGHFKRTRLTPPPPQTAAPEFSADLRAYSVASSSAAPLAAYGVGDISVGGGVQGAVDSQSQPQTHTAAPNSDEEKDVVTPFISKLTYLLEHQEYEPWVRWDASGNNILIAHTKPHLLEILARYFRHTTVASFVRQLNIYGFKRASTTSLLSILDTVSFPTSVTVPGHSTPDTFSASDYSAFSNPAFFRSIPGPGGRHCRLGALKPITKERGPRNRGKKAQAAKRKAKEQAGEEDESG
ncbi:hypothetical protein JCM10213_006454 [Rhodosporidiobolus nylandii]